MDRTGSIGDEAATLHRRAQELARREQEESPGERIEVVEFRLGEERFCIRSNMVKEVVTIGKVTEIPHAPPYIFGIIMIRGRILSLVNLKIILGFADSTSDNRNALVLSDGVMEFGLLSDSVEGVHDILAEEIKPYSSSHPFAPSGFLKGVVPGPASLLEAGLLLSDQRMRIDQSQP